MQKIPYCCNVQGLGTAFQKKGLASFVTLLYKVAFFRVKKVFFENTKGPYECRYCHKRISRKYMQIDHIVPVLQAKKNPRARNILKRMHAESVNDLVNLAPCCSRCNRQKGSKMGIWVLKGRFGDKGWFRALEKIMICVLLFLVFVAVTGTIHYLIK